MALKGLAILDDQSNTTIVDPSITSALNIPTPDVKHTHLSTTTIQGTSCPEPYALIDGLVVSSIDGANPIPLPSSYINKQLPNVIDEVPSKDVFASIEGLQHL